MIVKAKYNGSCSRCHGKIVAGVTMIEWNAGVKGVKHANEALCNATPSQVPAPQVPAVVLERNVGIAEFLGSAAEHLKRPKARFLGPDGKSELRLALAAANSKNPGAIYVTLAGQYIGKIMKDGTVIGSIAKDKPVLETLRAIAEDPANAAAAYGALMGRCSFCNLKLTDEGSTSVGYGPICAANYGLPWVRLGVPELTPIPEVPDVAVQ